MLGERRGLGPSLSPGYPAAGLQEARWRMAVEDGGEDTLDAFKRVSAGLPCSVPCPASLWPVEEPSVTRALKGQWLYGPQQPELQHQLWLRVLLSNIGTGTINTHEGRVDRWGCSGAPWVERAAEGAVCRLHTPILGLSCQCCWAVGPRYSRTLCHTLRRGEGQLSQK